MPGDAVDGELVGLRGGDERHPPVGRGRDVRRVRSDRKEVQAGDGMALIDDGAGREVDDGNLSAARLGDEREELIVEVAAVHVRRHRRALLLLQRLWSILAEHAKADHVHLLSALEGADRDARGRLRAGEEDRGGGDGSDGRSGEDESAGSGHHVPLGLVGRPRV